MPDLSIPVPVVDPLRMAWLDCNDTGNAERFVIHAGGLLRHVPEKGWIAYDGKRWSFDAGGRLAVLKAHDVAKGLREELNALRAIDDADIEQKMWKGCTAQIRDDRVALLGKHAVASGNFNKTRGMLSQAEALLSVRMEDFDQDPLAFNVRNGTLRFVEQAADSSVSGEAFGKGGRWSVRLDRHEPADMISQLADVDYDAAAACPKWRDRLNIVQPEPDQRKLMQQIHGYALVGIRDEQKFILAQGRGGDGKSLTYAVIIEIMGSYYRHADVSSFLAGARKSGSDHSEDLARLSGDVRLVTCDEPEKGATFNTKIIKQMTGGGRMTVRALRESSSEFVPRWFLIMECNPMPRVPTSDDGFWRRCLLFQWPVQFTALGVKAEPFTMLKDSLLTERSGILNWMIEGTLAWLSTRELAVSKRSEEVKDEYRRSSDRFGEWFLERADISDGGARTLGSELYKDFKEFCEDQGDDKVMAQRTFGGLLTERQLRNIKSGGYKYRVGIKLKPFSSRDSAGADSEGGYNPADDPVDLLGDD